MVGEALGKHSNTLLVRVINGVIPIQGNWDYLPKYDYNYPLTHDIHFWVFVLQKCILKWYMNEVTHQGSVTVNNWKQTVCILMGNWLNNPGYIYTMEYYTSIKRMSIVFMSKIEWSPIKV